MPLLYGKYDYRKVYRPSGTRYAKVTVGGQERLKDEWDAKVTAGVAAEEVVKEFRGEFGRTVVAERAVIEIVFDSFGATATLFELPERAS